MKRIRIIEDDEAICTELKTLLLANGYQPVDELLAFGMDGDDFIRKPYHSSVLLARIGRILKKTYNDRMNAGGLPSCTG